MEKRSFYLAPVIAVCFMLLLFLPGAEAVAKEPPSTGDLGLKTEQVTLDDGSYGLKIVSYTGKRTRLDLSNLSDTYPVVAIGNAVFSRQSFTSVILPDTLKEIGKEAFSYCEKLSSIRLPEGISSIGQFAFSGCKALKKMDLPASLRELGEEAFKDCGSLASVEILGAPQRLPKALFSHCPKLNKVVISAPIQAIGAEAFWGCRKLSSVTLPDTLEEIGSHAFDNCDALTEIALPTSLRRIGSYAFRSSGLKTFPLNDIHRNDTIGIYAFAQCAFTSLLLPKSITSLPDGCFAYNDKLKSVTLPKGLTDIGDNTFHYCEKLVKIDFPQNLQSIGHYAFLNCSALSSATFEQGLKIISSYAFADCKKLKTAELPNSLTYLGDSAFSGTALQKVTIPASLSYVGKMAFLSCKSLKNVTLEPAASHRDWGLAVFLETPFSKSIKEKFLIDGDTLLLYVGKDKDVTIPEGVRVIAGAAFYKSNVQKLTLPSTLITVGDSAFAKMKKLTAVNLPASCAYVGSSAFYSCTKLKEIEVEPNPGRVWRSYSITDTPYMASLAKQPGLFIQLDATLLYYRGQDRVVQVPDGVQCIADSAFAKNNFVQQVLLPDSVTILDHESFTECNALAVLPMSDKVELIGKSAFANCMALSDVTMGKGVRVISEGAFYNCGSIRDVALPESVECVESYAFCIETGLRSFTVASPGTWLDIDLFGGLSIGTFTAPFEYKTRYLWEFDY
jgi:hypothetical protein